MKIKPMRNLILVKPTNGRYKKEEEFINGIFIPSTADKTVAPTEGVVLDVGEKACKDIKIGSKIMFKKFAYEETEQDGEVVLLMQDEACLLIL